LAVCRSTKISVGRGRLAGPIITALPRPTQPIRLLAEGVDVAAFERACRDLHKRDESRSSSACHSSRHLLRGRRVRGRKRAPSRNHRSGSSARRRNSVAQQSTRTPAARSGVTELGILHLRTISPAPDWRQDCVFEFDLSALRQNHLGDLNKYLPTVHGFDEYFGYLYHLDAMSDPFWYSYPTDPAIRDRILPRNLIHSYATDVVPADAEARVLQPECRQGENRSDTKRSTRS